MSGQVLLIDLENVQTVDLSLAPGEVRVLVFYGVTQQKLPEELVVQAQPLNAPGPRAELSSPSLPLPAPSQAPEFGEEWFTAARGTILAALYLRLGYTAC